MADNSGFPIDIQAAKNTKLFKKFMQSKNKSVVVMPAVNHVQLPHDRREQNFNTANRLQHSPVQTKTYEYQQPTREQQTYKQELRMPIKQQSEFVRKTVETKYTYPTFQVKQNRGFDDYSQLRKKYERVANEYEELKERIAEQRKYNKKQILKLQSEIQSYQKKIFQVASHEDELILENKRLKEKSSGESKDKIHFEQENRELSYQIQELKDMMEGQERLTKRRQEESSHWRKQNEEMKMHIKDLNAQIEKLQDCNAMLERQKMAAMKDTGNKEGYVNELREKINSLISENSDLRDQIFQLTSRAYNLEQQNTALRAEVRRHSDQMQHSHLQDYHNILSQPRVQTRINSTMEHSTPNQKKQQPPTNDRRRRGEFARERGQKKIENLSERPPQQAKQPQQNNRANEQQKMRRLDELNQQLQKIQDMKAINGNIRRQKIGIQREILEIEEYFRGKKQ